MLLIVCPKDGSIKEGVCKEWWDRTISVHKCSENLTVSKSNSYATEDVNGLHLDNCLHGRIIGHLECRCIQMKESGELGIA